MPRQRPPNTIWKLLRRVVWERDDRPCVPCHVTLLLSECHIDHIKSGKYGTNKPGNLRTLCSRCHVLRADPRHRGLIAEALRDGVIGPDWREEVWEG